MEADLLAVNLAGLYMRLSHHKGAGQLDLSSLRVIFLDCHDPRFYPLQERTGFIPYPLKNRPGDPLHHATDGEVDASPPTHAARQHAASLSRNSARS